MQSQRTSYIAESSSMHVNCPGSVLSISWSPEQGARSNCGALSDVVLKPALYKYTYYIKFSHKSYSHFLFLNFIATLFKKALESNTAK